MPVDQNFGLLYCTIQTVFLKKSFKRRPTNHPTILPSECVADYAKNGLKWAYPFGRELGLKSMLRHTQKTLAGTQITQVLADTVRPQPLIMFGSASTSPPPIYLLVLKGNRTGSLCLWK